MSEASKHLGLHVDDPELLESALLDVYGRFITLLPEEILRDHVHLCFYLQEAYWWYSDKWQTKYPINLPRLTFKQFLNLVIDHNPLIRAFVNEEQQKYMLTQWKGYVKNIPLRGAILISSDCNSLLLVQAYGSGNWTFPRGKRNQDEQDIDCATREVLEETGLDISKRVNAKIFIEEKVAGRSIKLFPSPGWNKNLVAQPRTDFEIRNVEWVPLCEINQSQKGKRRDTYDVIPFIQHINKFISDFKKGVYAKEFAGEYLLYRTVASFKCGGSSNSVTTNFLRESQKTNTSGCSRLDLKSLETFGTTSDRLSPDDMFKVNKERFGVETTFNPDEYGSAPPRKRKDLVPFQLDGP